MVKLDTKDELKGYRDYKKLAKKLPCEKIAIKSMATDELKHSRMIKQIKSKVLDKAKK